LWGFCLFVIWCGIISKCICLLWNTSLVVNCCCNNCCVQVVMGVAQLYHHLAPRSEVMVVAKALIRLLRSHREVQSVVLNCIASISTLRKVCTFMYILLEIKKETIMHLERFDFFISRHFGHMLWSGMAVGLYVIKLSNILEFGFVIQWQSELPSSHYYHLQVMSLLACYVFSIKPSSWLSSIQCLRIVS
jgi:hypothetical protein